MEKTITAYLLERGQNPEEFSVVIKEFGNKMTSRGGWSETTYASSIRDIKRIGEMVVVLVGKSYLSGYPGIRRSTVTTVFVDGRDTLYHAENVHIDGGYKTQHLDREDEDFREIHGAVVRDDSVAVVVVDRSGNRQYVVALNSKKDTDYMRQPALRHKQHNFSYANVPAWEVIEAKHSTEGWLDLNWQISVRTQDRTKMVKVSHMYGNTDQYVDKILAEESPTRPEEVRVCIARLKKKFDLKGGKVWLSIHSF